MWRKEERNGKRSIIMLATGTAQNKDWILMNFRKLKRDIGCQVFCKTAIRRRETYKVLLELKQEKP